MKKNIIIAITFIVVSSCQTSVEPIEKEKIVIEVAGKEAIDLFDFWAQNSAGRVLESFEKSSLYRIEDLENNLVLYSALNVDNPNESILVGILKDGTVVNPFKTIVSVLDDLIITEIIDMGGTLLYTITDSIDGTRSVISNGIITGGRIQGWWGDFEDCFGITHAPTESNVANALFVFVADGITFGGYTGASLIVCAGVATGQSLQKKAK